MSNPFDDFATAVSGLMSIISQFTSVYGIAARLVHNWQQLSHLQRVEFGEGYPDMARELLQLEHINVPDDDGPHGAQSRGMGEA